MLKLLKVILLLFSFTCYSQENNLLIDTIKVSKNAVYLDIGGSTCTPFSIHYNYIFKTKTRSYFDIDAGIGYYPKIQRNLINECIGLSALFNWNTKLYKKHHMQYGTGITYSNGLFQEGFPDQQKRSVVALFANLRVGYKYQKPQGGIFFQIYASPLFRLVQFSQPLFSTTDVFPFAGIGTGYSW